MTGRMSGEFEARVFRPGRPVEVIRRPNLILNAMGGTLTGLLGGAPATAAVGQIGFGRSAAAPADRTVAALDRPLRKAFSAVRYPPGAVAFDWALGTGDLNGVRIREFGLFAGNALVARLIGSIEKTALMALEGSWTIRF